MNNFESNPLTNRVSQAKPMKPLLFCLLLSTVASAQMPMVHFEMIPDFRSAYPDERIYHVAEGETKAFPTGEYDLVWIEGTCIVPRDADLDLQCREIVVTPTGCLDCGTEADPVKGKITVTFANGGFLADDPGQWGFGLLVFGRLDVWGNTRPTWVEGDQAWSLDVPGWQDSDKILYPDTVPAWGHDHYRSGLTGPTEGNAYVDSLAANTSSNIIFQSENPAGTRGHVIITDDAECIIAYSSFIGMGRTKPEPISETNLIGRYPIHFHHSKGKQRIVRDVVVDGLDYRSKWGIVLHGTSWATVEDCVVTRVDGGGIVTEDGDEVGNKICRNLVFDCFVKKPGRQKINAVEGFDGAGFWMAGMANYLDDNVAINCQHGLQTAITVRSGFGSDNEESIPKQIYQSSPGGKLDGEISAYQSTLSCSRNRFVNNRVSGYDAWGSKARTHVGGGEWDMPLLALRFDDCVFAYNKGAQVANTFSENNGVFVNCVFENVSGNNTGIANAVGYPRNVFVDGCEFKNMRIGLMSGWGTIVRNSLFDVDHAFELNALTSNNFIFGATFDHDSNVYLGDVYRPRTIDPATIIPCISTLEEVYAAIDEYRDGVVGPIDERDAERNRLTVEIEKVRQQVAVLVDLLEDLEAQLEELEEM